MFTAKITDNFSFLILTTSGSCMIPTSNFFYVIILTNFYQLPWLKEKEINRKEIHGTSKPTTLLHHGLFVSAISL